MLSPEEATRLALKGMFGRKSQVIPCLSDRLVTLLCPLLPSRLLHALTKKYAKRLNNK